MIDLSISTEEKKFIEAFGAEIDTRLGAITNLVAFEVGIPKIEKLAEMEAELSLTMFKLGRMYESSESSD